jgi:hypothetical protein
MSTARDASRGGGSFVALAKPLVGSHAARKRGNPNWGKPTEAVPDIPTAFEEQVQRLGLNQETCTTSEKLKQWCERNKDYYYIPESLLKQWGIQVSPKVSG